MWTMVRIIIIDHHQNIMILVFGYTEGINSRLQILEFKSPLLIGIYNIQFLFRAYLRQFDLESAQRFFCIYHSFYRT